MTEEFKRIIFKVPANIKVAQALLLTGELKDFFSQFAGSKVILINEAGGWIEARLDKKGAFLKGEELIYLLLAQGTRRLEFSYLGKNIFRLAPAPPILDPLPQTQPDRTAVQLNLGFEEETQDTEPAAKDSNKPAKPATEEKGKVKRETPKKQWLPRAQDVKTSTTSVNMPSATQRASVNIKNKEKPKTKISPYVTDSSTNVTKKTAKDIQHPKETHLQSLVPTQTKNFLQPAIPPADSTIKVTFHDEEAHGLFERVYLKSSSPSADFYLRQQALRLSVSPGFELLLSQLAARNLQPLDYQLRTVRHVLMNLRGRALLCDEVGMGKTVEAGLIALEYILRGLARRVLVLSPPSLVKQWQEEMSTKFNLDFVAYDSAEFKSQPDPWSFFPRIIASIDTAKRGTKQEQVLAVPYDLVIVDEAHHLKKQRSQAYQLVSQLKKKYILLLTATPVENDLEELFNLITLLLPGQLETAASFKRKYITRGDPLKPKNADKLKQLIREVMVRNRRSETGAIAGKRSADLIRIELTPEEKAFYQRLTIFVRGYYRADESKAQKGVHAFVLKILQREAGSSIEAVVPTLKKMADNPDYPESLRGVLAALARQAELVPHRAKAEALLKLLPGIKGKLIVFTGFTETQRYLVRTLRSAGLQVAELHSGLRRQEKEEQVRLFAEEANILISTETGSEGRNLQFANHMVNYDLPWNPMRIEQRIGRIHRIGQEKDVHIYNFSAADTLEAHILDILDAKINMFQLVVGELDMILGDLTEKRDFEDLIMDIWAQADTEERLKSEMDELGNRLVAARDHYLAVKEIDDRLLGELAPEEEE